MQIPPTTPTQRRVKNFTMTRILIVEDERIVARDLSESLQRMGYEVVGSAASSEAALDLAAKHLPELVMMDIRISGDVDGVTTAEVLRTRFGIPVIYLTAYADEETLARATATAPLGFILKPFKSAEIRGAIEVALVRHGLEREVRESEHWLSTTLRCVGDAVVAVSPEGKVRFVNHVAAQLLGVPESEALDQDVEDVVRLVDENSHEPIENPVTRAIARRRPASLQRNSALFVAPREMPIEDSCTPIIDEAGKLLGAVLVFRDVTEQRRAQMRTALDDRLTSLGTLVAGVAHELSNPLTAVVGHTELLADELSAAAIEAPPKLRRQLESANSNVASVAAAVRAMSDIVSDLRLFASPQPDQLELVDVRAALEFALRRTASQTRARARVVTEFVADATVMADMRRLTQVFVNLLTNAAHAIAPGAAAANEILVRLDQTPTGEVRVSVRDTGCGMSSAVAQRIFDPFFTTKVVGEGAGLGLAISHGIVQSFHGAISVVSEPGKGSLFVVLLPSAHATQPG